MKKRVVLLQAPFLKAAGSHNDRIGLELCYASRFLAEAGVEHVVVNGDYSGTPVYLPWRVLFENQEMYQAACDGKSPVIDQCVEEVMQFEPGVVVVAAGDNYIPTKNLGSPYIAFHVAEKISKYAKVFGIGPQFTRDPYPFREPFDGFFVGPVNESLVDMVTKFEQTREGRPLEDMLPEFQYVYPAGQSTDYILSRFGCPFKCNFCYTPVIWKEVWYRSAENFVRDVHTRILGTKRNALYINDMCFPARISHVKQIGRLLKHFSYQFTCESRLIDLSDEMAEALKDVGVRTVKLGIEALDDKVLKAMDKRQSVADIAKAVRSFKKHGFTLVGYLLFGSYYDGDVKAMEKTIREAEAMTEIDYWVVNVASFINLDWKYSADSHFSVTAAERQGVPKAILLKAMDVLQKERANPTVRMIGNGRN